MQLRYTTDIIGDCEICYMEELFGLNCEHYPIRVWHPTTGRGPAPGGHP